MQVVIAIIVGAIVLYLVFMACWILLVVAFKIFSMLVLYWMVGVTGAFVAGLLFAFVIPLRVLRGRDSGTLRQLTPQDVVDGKAFRARARGDSRHYGWDRAWPTYIPYQARLDAYAVWSECHQLLGGAGSWVARTCRTGGSWGATTGSVTARVGTAAGRIARTLPRIGLGALLFPLYGGFYLGVWTSILAWLALMFVVGGLSALVQWLGLSAYRWSDVLLRIRSRAEMRCPNPRCYAVTTLPSYRCSNPTCSVIHRRLLPGPLGLSHRRCACGTKLPNTIRRAGARLQPICPTCNAEMARGSGTRQTIVVPVVGTIGAGKTRLLAAATVQLERRIAGLGGTLRGLTPPAVTYLETARSLIDQHANMTKTPASPPTGVPLLLTAPGKRQVEIQLMDAAGEGFGDWTETSALRYLDQSQALVYVLDPLAFPDVAHELQAAGLAPRIQTATGDQEEAYGAAVDRMRSENVKLKQRELALVMTKADILRQLPIGTGLNGANSSAVRDWLIEHHADLLVRRCEKDFERVSYFVVDSMNIGDDRSGPVRVLEWMLHVCQCPIAAQLTGAPGAAEPEPEMAAQ